MASLCEMVDRFAYGELSAAAAEDFRKHLAACSTCPVVLERTLVLDCLAEQAQALAEPTVPRTIEMEAAPSGPQEAPDVHPPPASWWRRLVKRLGSWRMIRTLPPLIVLTATAIIALGPWLPGRESPRLAILERPSCRATLGRVAYGDYAQPVPCRVIRAGGRQRGRSPTSQRTLARLAEAGDEHGLAVASLADGDLRGAAEYLARAGASLAVISDGAVLALERGEFEGALAIAGAVLRKDPTAAAARWNRAVALARLGHVPEAAAAFGEISAGGELGWAEEAQRQEAALRSEAHR